MDAMQNIENFILSDTRPFKLASYSVSNVQRQKFPEVGIRNKQALAIIISLSVLDFKKYAFSITIFVHNFAASSSVFLNIWGKKV